MGLGTAISSALEAARLATESLQVEVQHEEWLRQDALGKPEYDTPVSRMAQVSEGRRQISTPDGRVVTVKASLAFFPDPNDATVPAVKAQDRITLPSGVAGIVLDLPSSSVNPATGMPYVRTVWLV